MYALSGFVIFSAVASLRAVHALPAQNNNGGALQAPNECPADCLWYTCAQNNFVGCCSVDPCHNQGICPESDSTPQADAEAQPACSPGTKTALFALRTDSINSQTPDSADSINNHINVFTNKEAVVGQAITFPHVPAAAQNCSLGWVALEGDKFVAESEGSVHVFELATLPAEPVTWNTLYDPAKSLVGKQVGSPAFTGWTVDNEREHNVGPVDCKPDMSFFTRIPDGKEGRVEIAHSGSSGWYLDYVC
jgi:hypothetical protein